MGIDHAKNVVGQLTSSWSQNIALKLEKERVLFLFMGRPLQPGHIMDSPNKKKLVTIYQSQTIEMKREEVGKGYGGPNLF